MGRGEDGKVSANTSISNSTSRVMDYVIPEGQELVEGGSDRGQNGDDAPPIEPVIITPRLIVTLANGSSEEVHTPTALEILRANVLSQTGGKLGGRPISSTNSQRKRRSVAVSDFTQQNNLMSAFVPDLCLQHLNKLQPPIVPEAQFMPACCLCADISGFTALSERHAKEGEGGLDKLVTIINMYYAQLVNSIYAYGGDIIKIAGDALFCTFLAVGTGSEETMMRRALVQSCRCALILIEIKTADLSLHCGISSGELCMGVLGGVDDYWEFLISGDLISTVAGALDEAKKQQAVVSSETVKALNGALGGKLLESGNMLLEMVTDEEQATVRKADNLRSGVPPALAEMMKQFVPLPVKELVCAGVFNYMAEMRTVTTLFMKLDGYDVVEHRNLLSLQKHLTRAQGVLSDKEGFLRQFIIDDKGCVLIACWGVPGRSHSDDPARAIAAAVDLRRFLAEQGMAVSQGVTTGRALCGRIGGKLRSEYAMVGDVINLAARFMGKSKGRILCDEATYVKVVKDPAASSLFTQLEPMALKGKSVPISPYLCQAETGDDLWHKSKEMQMVGRLDLIEMVNELLGGFMDVPGPAAKGTANRRDKQDTGPEKIPPWPDKAKVVVIEGSEGTGKTLIANRLQRSTVSYFRFKCFSYAVQVIAGVVIPYVGLSEALCKLLGQDKSGGDEAIFVKSLKSIVSKTYGSDEDTILNVAYPALQLVLGVDMVGGIYKHQRKLPSTTVHVVICEIVVAYIGRKPTVLILENIHNLDNMSWKLLLQLVKCRAPLMFVNTIATESLSATPLTKSTGGTSTTHKMGSATALNAERLRKVPGVKVYPLLPFSREEVELLCNMAKKGQSKVTPQLVQTVWSLSGGNPYWAVELLHYLQDNDLDQFIARLNKTEGGEGEEGPVGPDNEGLGGAMAVLVVCRYEQLSVEQQTVLRYAAVAGMEFTTELLSITLPPRVAARLELLVQCLVSSRFVKHSQNSYYSFDNPLLHSTIYSLIPASAKRDMHQGAAEFFEANHSGDPLFLPITILHHIKAETEPARIIELCCHLAVHALIAMCLPDCLESLKRCEPYLRTQQECCEVQHIHSMLQRMLRGLPLFKPATSAHPVEIVLEGVSEEDMEELANRSMAMSARVLAASTSLPSSDVPLCWGAEAFVNALMDGEDRGRESERDIVPSSPGAFSVEASRTHLPGSTARNSPNPSTVSMSLPSSPLGSPIGLQPQASMLSLPGSPTSHQSSSPLLASIGSHLHLMNKEARQLISEGGVVASLKRAAHQAHLSGASASVNLNDSLGPGGLSSHSNNHSNLGSNAGSSAGSGLGSPVNSAQRKTSSANILSNLISNAVMSPKITSAVSAPSSPESVPERGFPEPASPRGGGTGARLMKLMSSPIGLPNLQSTKSLVSMKSTVANGVGSPTAAQGPGSPTSWGAAQTSPPPLTPLPMKERPSLISPLVIDTKLKPVAGMFERQESAAQARLLNHNPPLSPQSRDLLTSQSSIQLPVSPSNASMFARMTYSSGSQSADKLPQSLNSSPKNQPGRLMKLMSPSRASEAALAIAEVPRPAPAPGVMVSPSRKKNLNPLAPIPLAQSTG